LKKAHLDRAQQYAESAVAATAAALRNVSLDQLNDRNLGLVSSLAAYWDTLGWVYFGRGELAKAETYVSAAWKLGQHADEGDHLGQIYEKQGRKDDAIRAYAMALSAVRPDPETRGRLAALVGGESKVDAVVAKHREELQQARTIKLGKASQTGSAEFFVLLGRSSGGPAVEGTKFISGDDKLRGFGEVVRTAKYDLSFPDDTPTRFFRRGVVSCSTAAGECMFVMMLPDDVRSVD
jgi:tetratricopeptide (TPR) repeat protein